ncbi:MAG: UvrD-helicase domain-containing protein, partial [Eubacterium sp.]|nr:UvrD-helicase domain-containing protein [Eubacterium sp.]
MAVTWTKEQQNVIDSRGKSLLVSAAAGSGKTAVLVARILSKIMDPVSPVDIDRLLVVTFTNAAAAGMRERITKSIEEALKKDPQNTHLQRQSALIHNAQITTIDSFCLQLIRNHFHIIGLEPDFRVADPGELHLMKEEVFTKVIDHFYEEQDDAFLRFSENYSSGKNDDAIKEMVLALFDQARSNPWPKEWLDETRTVYDIADEADLSAKQWFQKLLTDLAHQARESAEEACHLIALCQDADGPAAYEEALRDDLAFYRALAEAKTYSAWYDLLSGHTFVKRKSIRNFEGDVQKKDYVSDRRDALKNLTVNWKKEFFPIPVTEQIEGIRATSEMYQVLCDLTLAFASAF